MNDPLQKQVGGDWYRKMKIQPVEFATINQLDPCAFSILKYVSRHRSKDGRRDVEKAKHFFELRCALPGVKTIPHPRVSFSVYCIANNLPVADANAVKTLGDWARGYAMPHAMEEALDRLLDEYTNENEETTS